MGHLSRPTRSSASSAALITIIKSTFKKLKALAHHHLFAQRTEIFKKRTRLIIKKNNRETTLIRRNANEPKGSSSSLRKIKLWNVSLIFFLNLVCALPERERQKMHPPRAPFFWLSSMLSVFKTVINVSIIMIIDWFYLHLWNVYACNIRACNGMTRLNVTSL